MTDFPELERLTLAGPCAKRWEELAVDGAVDGHGARRFCDECALHVHDLSSLARADAAALLREREGRLCVRYAVRRADGRVLTREDLPVARSRPSRLRTAWRATAAAFLGLAGLLPGCRPAREPAPQEEEVEPACSTGGEPGDLDPDALILLGYVGDE